MRLTGNGEKLFENIFNSTKDKVYSFAKKILRDDSKVQDCMQQCYMKLWESLDNIDTDKDILPLLYTYARNICIDQLRRNSRYVWQEDLTAFNQHSGVYNDAEQRIAQQDADNEINKLLDGMPARQKQVFTLIKLNGFSYKEVSEYLEISVSTVEKHLHKAIKSIPKEMTVRLLVLIFLSKN